MAPTTTTTTAAAAASSADAAAISTTKKKEATGDLMISTAEYKKTRDSVCSHSRLRAQLRCFPPPPADARLPSLVVSR